MATDDRPEEGNALEHAHNSGPACFRRFDDSDIELFASCSPWIMKNNIHGRNGKISTCDTYFLDALFTENYIISVVGICGSGCMDTGNQTRELITIKL